MFIDITIEGVTPLMLHRFTDEAQMSATSGTRSASATQDRGTPLEQCEACLYTSPDGELIIPQPMIMGSIIGGGKFFKAGKSKVSTQRSSLIPAAFFIDEPYMPLESATGWKVDSRPVRIPSTGGRIIRHRPMFDEWKFSMTAELDTQEIGVKLMREIIDAAGRKIGIGDFRPDCKGPFGRYVVTNWVTKDKA